MFTRSICLVVEVIARFMYGSLFLCGFLMLLIFFFQAEDGIRDLVRSRGLGDVYKRQGLLPRPGGAGRTEPAGRHTRRVVDPIASLDDPRSCLLYTSDAADERSSVDLGGRRILKKKNKNRRAR